MTDDKLAEAVARAIAKANCPTYMTNGDVECQVDGAWDLWLDEATAAIAAVRQYEGDDGK